MRGRSPGTLKELERFLFSSVACSRHCCAQFTSAFNTITSSAATASDAAAAARQSRNL